MLLPNLSRPLENVLFVLSLHRPIGRIHFFNDVILLGIVVHPAGGMADLGDGSVLLLLAGRRLLLVSGQIHVVWVEDIWGYGWKFLFVILGLLLAGVVADCKVAE